MGKYAIGHKNMWVIHIFVNFRHLNSVHGGGLLFIIFKILCGSQMVVLLYKTVVTWSLEIIRNISTKWLYLLSVTL